MGESVSCAYLILFVVWCMDSWKQNLKMNHPPIRNHAKELVPNNCSCSIKRLSSLVKRFCTLPAKMDSNPFCLLQTTLHRVIPANWHIFWHFIWHFWHWLYSDNLSAIHSDTLSDVFWRFIWHFIWHSIIFYLWFFLTHILTFHLNPFDILWHCIWQCSAPASHRESASLRRRRRRWEGGGTMRSFAKSRI